MDVRAPPTPGDYQLVLSLGVHGSLGEFPQQPLLVPAVITAAGGAEDRIGADGTPAPAPSTPAPPTPAIPAPSSASPQG